MEKEDLAEAMDEEEEAMVVEAAAVMAEAGATVVEAKEAMEDEGEAAVEVMGEEEVMEGTGHPSVIEALLRLRKVRKLTLQLTPLGDGAMGSPVSTIL